MGNDLLCGSSKMRVQPCKSSKTKSHKKTLLLGIVLALSLAVLVLLILALTFFSIKTCRKESTEQDDANMSPPTTLRRFTHLELLRATDGFNQGNLIGTGSFGSVYRARLQDGAEAAVKVFHLQFEGAFKSFDAECEVMKNIRHRNLVKIISSCSNDDFKALVLEYMPNGSLEDCLYSDNRSLDISERLNIMIDVALALEYLHFGYSTLIVHCDIKPSNVLLDESMVAHLSDFGIAKLIYGDQSMAQTQTLATIGYLAPEYGREGKVSRNSDVYSYGIMLMETFTRKKPTDNLLSGEMSLKHWVNDLFQKFSWMEVVDINLLSTMDEHFAEKEQCLSSVLQRAMECTEESPEERIKTKAIVSRLLKARDTFLDNTETGGL